MPTSESGRGNFRPFLLVGGPRTGAARISRGIISILICLIATAPLASHARNAPDFTDITFERPHYRVERATSAVKIDAVLDEQAWQDALTLELPYEIQPGDNTPAPVRTEFMITCDDRALLVAFRCHDPDPSAIRARVADRDTPWHDDFAGIIFDPFNDERRGFELFVNPMGVQMDLSRNDVGSGNQEDSSWDCIWESAGRITERGYIVEFAVPFTSIRFQRSDGEQTWNIFPFRAYPRSVRHQLSHTPWDRDLNCSFCQYAKFTGFEGASPGRNLEFDPTLTMIRTDTVAAEPRTRLLGGGRDVDPGLSMRWGVTPNLSLNGALNPDFSQVEADVAQLDINERFALFYPEKRPFFQEGADFFETPLQAVYTRTVADPDWGVKMTGKEGRGALGMYAVRDATSNILIPSNQGSDLVTVDDHYHTGVFRYRHDVGGNSTVGGLVTLRDGPGYYNRLYGGDGFLRLTSHDGLRFQVLGSTTAYPDDIAENEDFEDQPRGAFDGMGTRILFTHETSNWNLWTLYQDKSPEFRADAGFITRVDARSGVAGVERVFWGDSDDWYNRFHFGTEFVRTHDYTGRLSDQLADIWVGYAGPLQTWAAFSVNREKEFFDGNTYDQTVWESYIEMQPTGNFSFWFNGNAGDAIDYDNSRPATRIWGGPGFRYYFGRHVELWMDDTFEQLNVDAGRLYRANLIQTRLVYQMNVRTFIRAIFQYVDVARNPLIYDEPEGVESRSRDFFSQLLFSYKINPQTVLFLGYSDRYDDADRADVIRTSRTFFLKIGYAWIG